jgi:hypothetical protein
MAAQLRAGVTGPRSLSDPWQGVTGATPPVPQNARTHLVYKLENMPAR